MRSIGVLCGLVMLMCGGCASSHANVKQVKDANQLKSMMDGGGVKVIHSLDAENYAKGHIPGAVNIDYEKMTREMLPAEKDAVMVFYCAGGMCPVGRMAANKAADWGYTNVWVYEGGMKEWSSSGRTVDK